jgi:mono/diheme cytochrome c family protein
MRAQAILAAVTVATLGFGAASASAQQEYSGNTDYQTFCSVCHGPTAKGDGSIASSLAKRPPDLTQLSIRNDAVFSEEKVSKTISGNGVHTKSDMPAWSEVFARSQESAGAEAAQARITAIVHYLATIQEKR